MQVAWTVLQRAEEINEVCERGRKPRKKKTESGVDDPQDRGRLRERFMAH